MVARRLWGTGSFRVRAGRVGALLFALTVAMIGCSRAHYRTRADRDTYDILDERSIDPRWRVPKRPVEASTLSRIGDPFNPDSEPIPLDDAAARLFQATNGRKREFFNWEKRGTADVESDDWRLHVATNKNGEVVLDRESVIRLALLNSRDYQLEVENLYEAALTLTLARYEFYLQPLAKQSTLFNQLAGGKSEQNQLLLNQSGGFSQNFASGGQLLVDLANAMVFNFNSKGVTSVTSNLGVAFTQPLLRGAFARFRTQALSLQERNTLYALRSFAHFRRQFYVDVVAQGGYLGLLELVQSIRNQEANVNALARNVEELDELLRLKMVAQKDRDLVAINYQSALNQLIFLKAGLQTRLDLYKIQLGLPTELDVALDDAPLRIFELSNPQIDVLRKENEDLFVSLLQEDVAPSIDDLTASANRLKSEFSRLAPILVEAERELARWRTKLGQLDSEGRELPLPPQPPKDSPLARQFTLAERVRSSLAEARLAFDTNLEDLQALLATLPTAPRSDSWLKLRRLAGKEFNGRVADVLVSQTQARVFLIDLPAPEVTSEEAVTLGLQNRLDLMNNRARVTDAWRNQELAANRLLADLNIVYHGNLATDPGHSSIFRFDSSASSHQIGIEFDAPLVRRIERNAYRVSQIDYQQARRQWMLTRDNVVRSLRLDIRNLDLNRRQFEINREQLIIAARQIEETEFDQRTKTTTESSNTIVLLNALTQLLSAKNALISNWVSYQTLRMQLFADLDLMDIDSQGVWLNEHDNLARIAAANNAAPPESIPPAPPDAPPPL